MNADTPHLTVSGNNSAGRPELSVIVPFYNETDTVEAVLEEILSLLKSIGRSFEVLAINDGSTDKTADKLARLQSIHPRLRVLTLAANSGQSAAFGAGFKACRGDVTILMDGDGQNDPHDIPMLLEALDGFDACCGYRSTRRDTASKRLASRLANGFRRAILHDGIRDTGCSLKAIRTSWLRDLPMDLRGMHRFLPALLLMRGARITQRPVHHRPRSAGQSKYSNFGRLKETISDLWAVRWMQKRHRNIQLKETR